VTDLANRLRECGLQITPQRLAVMRAVTQQPHSTAGAVASTVRGDIGAISLQAVYDALRILTEKGLMRRIQPSGSPGLYDPRVDDNHHHVVCRTCGKATDVHCAVGAAACLSAADTDYQVHEAEVIFWGTCPDCVSIASRPDS
jgi:Fe2+ or Zn2+ uptake regulation protein